MIVMRSSRCPAGWADRRQRVINEKHATGVISYPASIVSCNTPISATTERRCSFPATKNMLSAPVPGQYVPCDRERGASRQRSGRVPTSRQRRFPALLRDGSGQAAGGTGRGGTPRWPGSGDRHRRRRRLAWLVHGLGARQDVEVVTVELDDEVQQTALSAPWPPWVRFESGDGAEVVGCLGQFDLIFPDAPGGKIFKLRRAVAALRRGGILVVDDMDLTRHDDEHLWSALAVVRHRLLGNAELVCAELGVSSGVIVATKRRS